ncbi:MAG: hypothetical protein H6736_22675 [Alphaproteobacteria bacterium]|nr:hypothetical protein [Alphaproteobacteria bacterium]MCB9694625.1 hypothetical protein [Alphaproteobacteria bacterium]
MKKPNLMPLLALATLGCPNPGEPAPPPGEPAEDTSEPDPPGMPAEASATPERAPSLPGLRRPGQAIEKR